MNLLRFLTGQPAAPSARATAAEPDPATSSSLLESLLGMAWVVEARDPYTGGHLWRVSRYAALLCEKAGTSPASARAITMLDALAVATATKPTTARTGGQEGGRASVPCIARLSVVGGRQLAGGAAPTP